MAQYRANLSDFDLRSTWSCTYYIEVDENLDETYCCTQTTATMASVTKKFTLDLPANSKITRTRVYAKFSGSQYGADVSTVDGKVPSNGYVTIANPSATATSVSVEFRFRSNRDNYESHDPAATTAHKTHSHSSTCTVSGVYLLIDYDVALSECGEPTSVTVSPSSVAPGAKVDLKWSGASAGDGNAITGYEIYRSTSEDSGYSRIATKSTTKTSGSTVVTAPTNNGEVYYYKVLTLGTYSGYNSGMSAATASLACSFAATSAPSNIKVETTNVSPGAAVNLSWSGAAAGTNNPIKGYEVYRATSASGEYSLLGTMTTAETSGSMSVAAPSTNGQTYYYKVKTLGTIDNTDSSLSAAYAALTCTYSAPSAPTTVKVNGATNLYIQPGEDVTLEWSGAADGANNSITGYTIRQDGEVLASGISPSETSYALKAPAQGGVAYAYTVVAQGVHSNSSTSPAATVYAYGTPAAPEKITVSEATPVAGSRVKLSWSGAAPGGYNPIKGYNIYRKTAVNGNEIRIASVSSKETSDSYYVDAPVRAGYSYYFWVETVGTYSNSDMSATYAGITAKDDTSSAGAEVTVKIVPKKRRKRKFIFGDYDTDLDGKWTVTAWSLSEPEPVTTFVDVPGRAKGPLDMTGAQTGGDTRFGSRTLSVRLESSEGTRMEREAIISQMLNRLHGYRKDTIVPDDETHFIVGRFSIMKEYNDMVHASVSVSAVCEPWRYSKRETNLELLADEEVRTTVLPNSGRMVVVPEIIVSGDNAWVELTSGSNTWTLTAGTYQLPGLLLGNGYTMLTYYGNGTIAIRYREAIL